jgi:GNAT superfamily N-acetyltransferase
MSLKVNECEPGSSNTGTIHVPNVSPLGPGVVVQLHSARSDTIHVLKSEISIVEGYIPGALGRVAELHAKYYSEQVKFGLQFELRVARTVGDFLARYDPQRDGLWFAVVNGRIEGTVSIDGSAAAAEGARLRWFIVSEELRCAGIGSRLLNAAVAFCRDRHYERIYLWTFEQFAATRRLYERHGFVLTEQLEGMHYGSAVREERYERRLRECARRHYLQPWVAALRDGLRRASARLGRPERSDAADQGSKGEDAHL